MNKLEEKLLKLGYKTAIDYDGILGIKEVNQADLVIKISNENKNHNYVYSYSRCFDSQQDIDNLQQAFNQLQKDLEVLQNE